MLIIISILMFIIMLLRQKFRKIDFILITLNVLLFILAIPTFFLLATNQIEVDNKHIIINFFIIPLIYFLFIKNISLIKE